MSSSLGNFATVENLVAEEGPNVVRTFLLSTAYHNRATFSGETLNEARERWERLDRAYDRASEAVDSVDARTKVVDEDLRDAVAETRDAFPAAMNDDFNTREALSSLLELASAVHRHLDENDEYDYAALRDTVETVEEFGGDVLGLAFGDGTVGGDARLADEAIELVLELREREREAGNYERADELRAELEDLGITVEDADEGPTFRR
jgi:cysteinyl-tRNA synthetase